MLNFPKNPGPARNQHRTSFGWAQYQAQHLFMGPALSPAVYPLTIRPLMLSQALAQQPHARPAKSPVRARPGAAPVGSNLTSLLPT